MLFRCCHLIQRRLPVNSSIHRTSLARLPVGGKPAAVRQAELQAEPVGPIRQLRVVVAVRHVDVATEGIHFRRSTVILHGSDAMSRVQIRLANH